MLFYHSDVKNFPSPENVHMHMYTCTCTHAHVHVHVYTCMCTHARVHMHVYTCTCTHARVQILYGSYLGYISSSSSKLLALHLQANSHTHSSVFIIMLCTLRITPITHTTIRMLTVVQFLMCVLLHAIIIGQTI